MEEFEMPNKITPQQINDFVSLFDNNPVEAIAAIQNNHQPRNVVKRKYPQKIAEDSVISVRSLTKSYKLNKHSVEVLKGIDLDIFKSEFVAITGASGSGKSTLLQLIGGLDTPTSGQIVVDGVDINHLTDAKRSVFRNKTIGFIFQFFYLQPFLQLNKNISVPGMFMRTPRHIRDEHVKLLLKRVGLEAQEKYFPKQLSGGQIQRAAVARALLNSPKVLLADEPTGNLDSNNSKAIIDLFEQVRNEFGTTIVVVTHNPEIAARADREIRLKDGVII